MSDLMRDVLFYPIADSTQVALFRNPTGVVRGSRRRSMKIGPWLAETHFTVDCDVDSQRFATAFVKIRKHLWAYVISAQDRRLYWLMFNGHDAGIKTGKTSEFKTGNMRETLNLLAPHVKGLLKFNMIKEKWENADFSEVYPNAPEVGVVDER